MNYEELMREHHYRQVNLLTSVKVLVSAAKHVMNETPSMNSISKDILADAIARVQKDLAES